MKTFRESKADQENIDMIVLQRGGISQADAIRVALAETATKSPKLAIFPMIPPLRDLDRILGILNKFCRAWSDAVRVGWPDHFPGESVERKGKVDMARLLNQKALAEFGPANDELRALVSLVRGAGTVNLEQAQRAAEYLNRHIGKLAEHAKDPNLTDEDRKKEVSYLEKWKSLITLLAKAGLLLSPLTEV